MVETIDPPKFHGLQLTQRFPQRRQNYPIGDEKVDSLNELDELRSVEARLPDDYWLDAGQTYRVAALALRPCR